MFSTVFVGRSGEQRLRRRTKQLITQSRPTKEMETLNSALKSAAETVSAAAPILGTVAMIADPSVEETNMASDRVETSVEENVKFSAQEVTTPTNPPGQTTTDSTGTGDLSGVQSTMLEKPYHLEDIQWKNGSIGTKSYNLPHALFSGQMETQFMLKSWFYFMSFYKFGIRFIFNVNPNPFNGGVLIAYYIPRTGTDKNNMFKFTFAGASVRVLPHATIHAKDTSEARFEVAYNNTTRMYYDDMPPIGQLRFNEWMELTGLLSAQNNIPISIWFALVDTQMAGATKGRIPFTFNGYAEMRRDLMSRLDFLSKNGARPGYMRHLLDVLTRSGVERREAGLLDLRPIDDVIQEVREEMEPHADRTKNFSRTTFNSANMHQSTLPVHDLAFDLQKLPSAEPICSHKRVNLKEYCTYPGRVVRFRQTDQQKSGTLLATVPVTPSYCATTVYPADKTKRIHDDTPCSAVAKHYDYWRGQMKYVIEDAASKMHRGRIKVLYIPNQKTAPSNPDEVRSVQTQTIDIGLQSDTTMIIDFQSATDWKESSIYPDGWDNLSNSTGTLAFYVMTQLNHPDGTANYVDWTVSVQFFGDFAYPFWHEQFLYYPNPEDEFACHSSQGSFSAASDTNLSAEPFQTSKELPTSYMPDHTTLEGMMTRPERLPQLTFNNGSHKPVDVRWRGSQQHLNCLSAFWRGRPTLTQIWRTDGNGIASILPYHSPHDAAAVTDYDFYVTNGGYICVPIQERISSMLLPWYHSENLARLGDKVWNPEVFWEGNINQQAQYYINYMDTYQAYFPMPPPGVILPGQPKSERSEQPSTSGLERRASFESCESDNSSYCYTSRDELAKCGDVETNPGPGDDNTRRGAIRQPQTDMRNVFFADPQGARAILFPESIAPDPLFSEGEPSLMGAMVLYANGMLGDLEPLFRRLQGCHRAILHRRVAMHTCRGLLFYVRDSLSPRAEETSSHALTRLFPEHVYNSASDDSQPTRRQCIMLGLMTAASHGHHTDLVGLIANYASCNLSAVPYDPSWFYGVRFVTASDSESPLACRFPHPTVAFILNFLSDHTFFSLTRSATPARLLPDRYSLHDPWQVEQIVEGVWGRDLCRRLAKQAGDALPYGDLYALHPQPSLAFSCDVQSWYSKMDFDDSRVETNPQNYVFAYFMRSCGCTGVFSIGVPMGGTATIELDMSSEMWRFKSHRLKHRLAISTADPMHFSIIEFTAEDVAGWYRDPATKVPSGPKAGKHAVMFSLGAVVNVTQLLLLLSGDVELNPGPDHSKLQPDAYYSAAEHFNKSTHKPYQGMEDPFQFANHIKQVYYFPIFEWTFIRVDNGWSCNFLAKSNDDKFEKQVHFASTFTASTKWLGKRETLLKFLEWFPHFLDDFTMQPQGFSSFFASFRDKVSAHCPAIRLLEVASRFGDLMERVSTLVDQGVDQVKQILCFIVKLLLSFVNLYLNPALSNAILHGASFVLDVISIPCFSGVVSWVSERLRSSLMSISSLVSTLFAPPNVPRKFQREFELQNVVSDGFVTAESPHIPEPEEEMKVHAGPRDLCESLVNVFYLLITGLTGTISSVTQANYKGACSTIYRGLAGLGVAGRGVQGMNIIVDTVGRVLHSVMAYVSGGVSTDERANIFYKANQDAILDFIEKVDETEEFYNAMAIRTNAAARQEIHDLFREGVRISEGCLFAKDASVVYAKLAVAFKKVSDWHASALKGAGSSTMRPEPVVVYLYGEPGKGKSILSTKLANDLTRFYGTTPDAGTFSMNCHSDHMDGYAQQPVVIYDDLNQDAKGEDWTMFCQLVSTTPFFPPMAELKEKGMAYTSPVMIATSNAGYPSPQTIREIGALQRRLKFHVSVDVKHRYQKEDGTLDLSKAIAEGRYDDISYSTLLLTDSTDSRVPSTRVDYPDLLAQIKEELVARAKVHKSREEAHAEQQADGPSFDEMMTHCSQCEELPNEMHAPHAPNCICHLCEALEVGDLSPEEFAEATLIFDKKMLVIDAYPVTSGRSMCNAWKMALDLKEYQASSYEEARKNFEPYGRYVAYYRDWDIAEGIKHAKKDSTVRQFFAGARYFYVALKWRKRRTLLNRLKERFANFDFAFWAKVGAILGAITTVMIFARVFCVFQFARSSERDQRITTYRAYGGPEQYARNRWWGDNVSTYFAPKFEIDPSCVNRSEMPIHIEDDKAVFPAGSVVDYQSKDCVPPTSGVYNGKVVGAPKSQLRTSTIRGSMVSNGGFRKHDQLLEKHSKNVVAINIVCSKEEDNCHGIGFFLSSDELLIPHHCLLNADETQSLEISCGQDGIQTFQFVKERCFAFRDESQRIMDCVLYKFPTPVKNIKKVNINNFIPENNIKDLSYGIVVASRPTGTDLKRVALPDVQIVKERKYGAGSWMCALGLRYPHLDQLSSGDSGALILGTSYSAKDSIAGFHVAGHSTHGMALILTREMVAKMKSVVHTAFGDSHIEGPIEAEMDAKCCPGKFPGGCNSYIGPVPHHPVSVMRMSQFEKSPIHGCVEVLREPAALRETDPRVTSNNGDPIDNAPLKFKNGVGHPREEHLTEVVEATIAEVGALLREADPPRVLTDYEMVNGLGVGRAFQQVELASSPGWPYSQLRSGGKKPWLEFESADSEGNHYLPSSVLKARLLEREALAQDRQRIDESYFATFLKDELRPLKKVRRNGTRTVECGPMDHLLLARKYFGHFINTVQSYPVQAFGCCVGINPEIDLSTIENYLREYSDDGVGEDYSLWDGTIKPRLIFACSQVINGYYEVGLQRQIEAHPELESQLREQFRKDCNVRDTLLSEIAFTFHVSGDKVIESPTGLPSGHFFTSILNSLLHRLINGLAWMKGTEKVPQLNTMAKFSENVRDVHYGDDGKDAVKKGVQQYYNRLVKQELATELGMTYTMPDKESAMVPISPLSEISYLKRICVPHKRYPMIWNVPMEKRTIHSLINWRRKNADFADNLTEAFREAYHHGEEYYNELKCVVANALLKARIPFVIPHYRWQDRNFLARFGVMNNPYVKKQYVTSQMLVWSRILLAHRDVIVRESPLVWVDNKLENHECATCGRSVLGLLDSILGQVCLGCSGFDEPEGYAHGEHKPPTAGQQLMVKYSKLEQHHISGSKHCPSWVLAQSPGGNQLLHHWCRGCERLCLHLERDGNARKCATCLWGIIMPESFFHDLCPDCMPLAHTLINRGKAIVSHGVRITHL